MANNLTITLALTGNNIPLGVAEAVTIAKAINKFVVLHLNDGSDDKMYINPDSVYVDVLEIVLLKMDSHKNKHKPLDQALLPQYQELQSKITQLEAERDSYILALKVVESFIESDAPGFAISKIHETLNHFQGK